MLKSLRVVGSTTGNLLVDVILYYQECAVCTLNIMYRQEEMQMKLQIEYVNKEELKPYANNAKIHIR